MRVDKARYILPFCGCEARDKSGITKVWVPAWRKETPANPQSCFVGHAKRALVEIKRQGDEITMTCSVAKVNKLTDSVPCPAAGNGFICFHCLAALMLIAEDTNNNIAFFKDREAIGIPGRVIAVHAGADIFVVVTPKATTS